MLSESSTKIHSGNDSATVDTPPTQPTATLMRRRLPVKPKTKRQQRRELLESSTLDRGRMPQAEMVQAIREMVSTSKDCHDILACANGNCLKIGRTCPG